MTTVRFINSDEIRHIYTMFSIDKSLVGETLTSQEINTIAQGYREAMDLGYMKITMVFDENESPVAMYTARLLPMATGWWVGATKIKEPTNHFNKTAKIMAPGLDLMLENLEAEGYYKFWMGAPEVHHNIRNRVMIKHSKLAHRYQWFDEYLIPKGQKTDIKIYEFNRRICNWSDILVRMFVLKQEYRVELLRKLNSKDYHGTLITDLE